MNTKATWRDVVAKAREIDPTWDSAERVRRRARIRGELRSAIANAPRVGRMDTTELRAAYAALLDEARAGGFGAPEPGEWTAEQVLAHLAVNDELLVTTTQRVLEGEANDTYYNHDSIDSSRLLELADERGGLTGLTRWLEQTSALVCGLADSLPQDDETLVHTHIVDGDTVRLDEPVPWVAVLATQARRHLPAHAEQLRALRKA